MNKSVIESQCDINLDKFYTKPSVAELCVSAFISNILIREQDLIVEPSAGNGSFIQPLKRIKCEKIFIDIAPDNNQIGSLNFLDWTPPSVSGKIHVIGNPPFGRQSSMCHKFIRHAAGFADSISFILPISFKKLSNINRIPSNFHLVKEIVLPLNSFTLKGVVLKKIPTVFQVWFKKDADRFIHNKNLQPSDFSFVSPNEANVAITRVGSSTGMIKLSSQFNLFNLTKHTHYFIKANDKLLIFLSSLDQLDYESSKWVCGAKSMSKKELINILDHSLKLN